MVSDQRWRRVVAESLIVLGLLGIGAIIAILVDLNENVRIALSERRFGQVTTVTHERPWISYRRLNESDEAFAARHLDEVDAFERELAKRGK